MKDPVGLDVSKELMWIPVITVLHLTFDLMLASACLPSMHQAVEMGGVPCWDGGYAGNPMMALLRRVIDPGLGEANAWRKMRMHRIASQVMTDLGPSSKPNAERPFLEMLFDEGRRCAAAFGRTHLSDLGLRSAFDIDTALDEV
jgi:NTE family protein